jgi:hypothetical protein
MEVEALLGRARGEAQRLIRALMDILANRSNGLACPARGHGGTTMQATERMRKDMAALWETLGRLQQAVLDPGPTGPLRMRNVLRYLKTEVLGESGQDEALFLDRLGNHPRMGELARLLAQERAALRDRLDRVRESAELIPQLGALDPLSVEIRAECEGFIREFVHHVFVEERVLVPEAERCVDPGQLEEIGTVMAALRAHARARDEIPALD